jgi:hypothetical protein
MKSIPARLTAEQVAHILGCQKHDIPVLARKHLLKPLGKPTQQAVKYYGAVDIEQKAGDLVWLSKATQALYDHWKHSTEVSPQ